MDMIKKVLGVVWIALGLYAGYDRIIDSFKRIGGETMDDVIFGWIILLVLTPIIVGSLVLFGYYSLTGEYTEEG
ncbi:MAG TPA: hypothetical protein DIW24_01490 [Bacteroidetes bacterium]|mgnify:CR=1 FL=1|nr:hypothetical protein [Bacteroidota bacterium]